MKDADDELTDFFRLAAATGRAYADLIILHSDALLLLRKTYNRATGNDPLNEGYQTRLDQDLIDEFELFLAIRPDDNEKATRPD